MVLATRVSAVESTPYEVITRALEGQSLLEYMALLWRLVEGRPAEEALARRVG